MLKQGRHPKIDQEHLGHSSIAVALDTNLLFTLGLQEPAAGHFNEIVLPRHAEEAVETSH